MKRIAILITVAVAGNTVFGQTKDSTKRDSFLLLEPVEVKAIRAVAATNGKNSISIIVPCHRVIGSNGDLTGYGGDLWRKKWLLDHEGKFANGVQTLF